MSTQRLCIKFYASGGQDIDQATYIPVFQDWIKTKALPDVMIDIADYRHVPNGPGMMLICHETDYAMDSAEADRLGLLAQRKKPQTDSQRAEIADTVKAGLKFLKQLRDDQRVPETLAFDLSGFDYIANDRLNVPNNDEGFAAVKEDLNAVAQQLYGSDKIKLERRSNHRGSRLAVHVTSPADADLDTLLQRI